MTKHSFKMNNLNLTIQTFVSAQCLGLLNYSVCNISFAVTYQDVNDSTNAWGQNWVRSGRDAVGRPSNMGPPGSPHYSAGLIQCHASF